MMERGEVELPRQYRHAPEYELDRKRVFSGYGDPTAAWHGTSSPTLARNPSPVGKIGSPDPIGVRTEVRACPGEGEGVCIKHFPSIIKKKKVRRAGPLTCERLWRRTAG